MFNNLCCFCNETNDKCFCNLTKKQINNDFKIEKQKIKDIEAEKNYNNIIKKDFNYNIMFNIVGKDLFTLIDNWYYKENEYTKHNTINSIIDFIMTQINNYHLNDKPFEKKEIFNETYNEIENNIIPKIKIIKLSKKECGIMPSRGTKYSAGWDIYTPILFELLPKEEKVIDTLIQFQIPYGYYGNIKSKSGLYFKTKIISYNGTIDNDFRGNLLVSIKNKGKEKYIFDQGDKICQMIIEPYLTAELELAEVLDNTERGNKGFGSTGK